MLTANTLEPHLYHNFQRNNSPEMASKNNFTAHCSIQLLCLHAYYLEISYTFHTIFIEHFMKIFIEDFIKVAGPGLGAFVEMMWRVHLRASQPITADHSCISLSLHRFTRFRWFTPWGSPCVRCTCTGLVDNAASRIHHIFGHNIQQVWTSLCTAKAYGNSNSFRS